MDWFFPGQFSVTPVLFAGVCCSAVLSLFDSSYKIQTRIPGMFHHHSAVALPPVFFGQHPKILFKGRRKTALAVITYLCSDLCNGQIGGEQQFCRSLHAVLPNMGGNGGAVDGFKHLFEGGSVDEILFCKRFDGNPL